mmetsp:Transcript_102662/g.182399  ORF Transcript_102662/g.182399 Transcript_102662/m.182399 type:complete len:219 (+) Transcript_102662:326-982(+)
MLLSAPAARSKLQISSSPASAANIRAVAPSEFVRLTSSFLGVSSNSRTTSTFTPRLPAGAWMQQPQPSSDAFSLSSSSSSSLSASAAAMPATWTAQCRQLQPSSPKKLRSTSRQRERAFPMSPAASAAMAAEVDVFLLSSRVSSCVPSSCSTPFCSHSQSFSQPVPQNLSDNLARPLVLATAASTAGGGATLARARRAAASSGGSLARKARTWSSEAS